MKKIFLFVALAISMNMSYAVSSNDVHGVGFDSLSEQDKLAIMKEIADKAPNGSPGVLAKAVDNVTNPEKVSQWVQLGADIGKGLAGAAKEVGVAANEFVNTPVGKWVAFLIIWHFMGSMAVHVGGGILILLVSITGIWFYTKKSQQVVMTYDKDKTDILGRSKLVSITREGLREEDRVAIIISGVIMILLWAVITFSW